MADWYNCTPSEAEEEYYSLRWSYNQDSNRCASIQQQRDNIYWQQCENRAQQNSLRNEAINFEQRVEDIENVISKLTGQGGFLGRVMCPDASIDRYNNKAQKTGGEYTGAIKCTGVTPADIPSLYRCPSVSENAHSAEALRLMRNECERLREAIRKINEQMDALDEATRQLAATAESLQGEYDAIRNRMNSTIYEMNHFAQMM